MDILCTDKTGTLTRNELRVTDVRPMPGFDAARVLMLAALASSEGGQDPVDGAIRTAAGGKDAGDLPRLIKFVPFDPATKMSEATVAQSTGGTQRVVKGAFAAVVGLAPWPREYRHHPPLRGDDSRHAAAPVRPADRPCRSLVHLRAGVCEAA
jgi:H+-transporting ATPase